MNVNEILGARLLTLHNLHVYLGLLDRVRKAIEDGTFWRAAGTVPRRETINSKRWVEYPYLFVAMAPPPAGGAGAPPQSPVFMFGWIAIMFAIFYMMIIRPQRRREKEQQELLRRLNGRPRAVRGRHHRHRVQRQGKNAGGEGGRQGEDGNPARGREPRC